MSKPKSGKKASIPIAPPLSEKHDSDDDNDEKDDDWDSYPLYLAQFVSLLCGKDKMSDVVFIVKKDKDTKEAKRFPSHKLILSASSPLFESMLLPAFSDQKDLFSSGKPVEIEIDGVDPTHFYSLLECIYSDKTSVDENNVAILIELARKYQVEKLQVLCADVLGADLTIENALTMFCMGSQLNDPEFGLQFIAENIEDILNSEGFLSLPRPQMKVLLSSDYLECDEIAIFNALLKWGEAQIRLLKSSRDKKEEKTEEKSELKSYLSDLIPYIRFPTMTMEEIAGQVAPSGYLTEQQLLDIFKFKAMSEDKRDDAKMEFPIKPREGTSLCRDSRLIVRKYYKDILGFFGKKKIKLTLLYRGSRDGYNPNSFHAKCNFKGSTFTIVKAAGRPNLFGGYVSSPWTSSNNYLNCDAWIYALAPRAIKFIPTSSSNAAYDHISYGPTWGAGHDLHINSSMQSTSNYSSPNQYTIAAPGYTGTLTQEVLAGSYNFTVEEIEVFSVQT